MLGNKFLYLPCKPLIWYREMLLTIWEVWEIGIKIALDRDNLTFQLLPLVCLYIDVNWLCNFTIVYRSKQHRGNLLRNNYLCQQINNKIFTKFKKYQLHYLFHFGPHQKISRINKNGPNDWNNKKFLIFLNIFLNKFTYLFKKIMHILLILIQMIQIIQMTKSFLI